MDSSARRASRIASARPGFGCGLWSNWHPHMTSARPLIGLPADRRMIGLQPFHAVGEKYARAVLDAADGLPLLVPALADELRLDELVERLDGLLFTGSPS